MGSPFPTFLIYSHCTGVSAVTYVMAFLFALCVCVCVCVLVQGGRGPGPSRPGQVSISLCTGVLLKHVLSVFVVIPLSSLCFAGQLVLEVMVSLYE